MRPCGGRSSIYYVKVNPLRGKLLFTLLREPVEDDDL
jgi:hypothetical protein